jgi:2-polyprenyl-6-methoxyphenol hydroxylase-like FAD-dependent oxidoreductase
VIGASVAGLLAACVLGDRYGQVTVIDRDELPTGPAARRGVPQSRQAHALLARGAEALDELLPGFTGDLLAAGAAFRDMQQEFSWYLDGYRIRPRASGLTAIGATRRLIEHTIRTRVAALPRVQIVDATEVLGVITSPGRERVVGVRVRGRGEAGPERELDAELVVDASGRGSGCRNWGTRCHRSHRSGPTWST